MPADGTAMTFTVTVEQLTTDHTPKLPDGSATKAPISPGIALVHQGANPLFTIGAPARGELQRIAEAGQAARPARSERRLDDQRLQRPQPGSPRA